MKLSKQIAQAYGRRAPAVEYELKQTVALAMKNPKIAARFDHWPTPDEYFQVMADDRKEKTKKIGT